MRLGEWLISKEHINANCIETALMQQTSSHAKLGDILLASRVITPLQWLQALKASGIHALDTDSVWNAGRELQNSDHLPHYIARHYIPLQCADGTIHIATYVPNDALQTWCCDFYQAPCTLRLITRRDFHHYLTSHFHAHLTTYAQEHLHNIAPEFSAKESITTSQRNGMIMALIALAICAYLAPTGFWYGAIIATTLFYIATLGFKLMLLIMAAPSVARHNLWRHIAANLKESELPTYSILVPLYKESEAILTQIIASLEELNYPKTKLDIWLITEQDDPVTREYLKRLKPADYFRILEVPNSKPRTKPKACNVALPLITGEFVTIYDAEDKPHPDQLRLSIAAFQTSSKRLACVQAPLNYYNRSENILTKLFSIEYSALFTLFLPALRRLRIPIPLGGTSNHIRTEALRAVNGWDPFNVTEDADLGIRLAYQGYLTDILPSLTLEESPISINAWLKQRSRWIKGYIQTWLVYMRSPVRLLKQIGLPAFLGFQFFVGAPAITFLLGPLFWGISIISLTGIAPALALPGWLLACCAITLVLGFALQWATAHIATEREQWKFMLTAKLLYPFYWILHSIACVKALWQLAIKPHYWEKTTHGQSRIFQKS